MPSGPVPAKAPPPSLVDVEALIKVRLEAERRRLADKVRAMVGQVPLLYRGQAKSIIYALADAIERRD